jgi:uncharacterized protein
LSGVFERASEPSSLDLIPQTVVTAVIQLLSEARASGVTIGFAIESGSRAWGFPSPDSDYDCRFVFIRSANDHLALVPHRDVIEFPISGELDVSGWDLRKALKLALKGNAVIYEWAQSPIIYEEMGDFRAELNRLLSEIIDPNAVALHYLGLARTQFERFKLESGEVRLKKLFYFVRPLIALQWMRDRDFAALPPMNFAQLLQGSPAPDDVMSELNELLEKKRITHELGAGAAPPELMSHFTAVYSSFMAQWSSKIIVATRTQQRFELAQNFYNQIVPRFSKDGSNRLC